MNTPKAFLVSLLLLVSIHSSVTAAKRAKDESKTKKELSAKTAKDAGRKRKLETEVRSKKTERVDSGKKSREQNSENQTGKRDRPATTKSDLARLKKNERAADRRRAEAKRLEEARRAAIAREQARNEALRERVQNMIAKDDLSGEDLEVRKAAVDALGNHAGTVVVMNPQTGRIYSIVNQQWAVREGFKPCSTIKLVTGLAGLNENVIDAENTTKISTSSQRGLTRALAYSSNGYFQEVGEQVGFEKMLAYSRHLGLGEKTGINARNEFEGRLPSFASRSNIHRLSSHGDDFEVTALQLATLVSAMGNGGKLLSPYIAHNRRSEPQRPKVRRQIKIDQDSWRQMIPGMVGAVNYGSGRRAHHPTETIAGKTGTCIEQGSWVGLFTSYAPLNNPNLAVVVITRGADARGHVPAAIAGRIYRDLSSRFGTHEVIQVAHRKASSFNDVPQMKDDEESSETEEVAPKSRRIEPATEGIDSDTRRIMTHVPRMPDATSDSLTNPVSTGNGQTRPRRVAGR